MLWMQQIWNTHFWQFFTFFTIKLEQPKTLFFINIIFCCTFVCIYLCIHILFTFFHSRGKVSCPGKVANAGHSFNYFHCHPLRVRTPHTHALWFPLGVCEPTAVCTDCYIHIHTYDVSNNFVLLSYLTAFYWIRSTDTVWHCHSALRYHSCQLGKNVCCRVCETTVKKAAGSSRSTRSTRLTR